MTREVIFHEDADVTVGHDPRMTPELAYFIQSKRNDCCCWFTKEDIVNIYEALRGCIVYANKPKPTNASKET